MKKLGDLNLFGEGIDKNLVDAVDWYTKASNLKQADALNTLGVLYVTGTGVRNA